MSSSRLRSTKGPVSGLVRLLFLDLREFCRDIIKALVPTHHVDNLLFHIYVVELIEVEALEAGNPNVGEQGYSSASRPKLQRSSRKPRAKHFIPEDHSIRTTDPGFRA